MMDEWKPASRAEAAKQPTPKAEQEQGDKKRASGTPSWVLSVRAGQTPTLRIPPFRFPHATLALVIEITTRPADMGLEVSGRRPYSSQYATKQAVSDREHRRIISRH